MTVPTLALGGHEMSLLVCVERNLTRSLCDGVAPRSCLLPIELLVEQEDEQVDVDLGFVKDLHDSHSLVLELE